MILNSSWKSDIKGDFVCVQTLSSGQQETSCSMQNVQIKNYCSHKPTTSTIVQHSINGIILREEHTDVLRTQTTFVSVFFRLNI